MNKTRLEAFSDGVLAIIITIMVLEFKIPHETSWEELTHLAPVFISYIMSFVYVGIYWGNHHHLIHSVKQVSPGIIWANMNQLFWLSLIPFATGWMGENHFASNTVCVYAILLLLCGASFSMLRFAVEKRNPLSNSLKRAYTKLRTKEIASVFGYGLAIVFAYIEPAISGGFFVAIAILWIVPDQNLERALREKE